MWTLWWFWVAAGIGLGILEIFLPGFVFLGFASGAVLTGLVMGAGGPVAHWLTGSFPTTMLFFAVLSLLSWLALRRVFGIRRGQFKIIDRDINED